MEIISIIIDACKLPLFKKRLIDAKYKFAKEKDASGRFIILKVKTDDRLNLNKLVNRINNELTNS